MCTIDVRGVLYIYIHLEFHKKCSFTSKTEGNECNKEIYSILTIRNVVNV